MVVPEFFHTPEVYLRKGREPFVQHGLDYLGGTRTVPVAKLIGLGQEEICFTFTDHLLKRFVSGDRLMGKAYETAMKYGFQGHSKGGRNGVFYQREIDYKLSQATCSLIARHESEVLADLDLTGEGLDALEKVKIVFHNPSGERVVGVYRTDNQRMIFLDFAHY